MHSTFLSIGLNARQPMRFSIKVMAALLALVATAATADVEVRFIEGAPKDRFEISNLGACGSGQAELLIDLSGSSAGLIFDVTAAGAGVQVFQPFEVVTGAQNLQRLPEVSDGDKQLLLAIRDLPAKGQIVFTIDVDDTIDQRGITVSGSEIAGASLRLSNAAGVVTVASFSTEGVARLKTAPCSRP